MTESKTNACPALLGLLTETSLHAGAGSSSGVIDLPIQREAHNKWPCVFGSAVKGALRTRGEQVWGDTDQLFSVFGPKRGQASDNAGALSVGDARLLLLPVRSLTTTFRWVTCPDALQRFQRDAARLDFGERFSFSVPEAEDLIAVTNGDQSHLFLEEYRLEAQSNDEAIQNIAKDLAQLSDRAEFAARLKERLTVVSNDLFAHLVRNATQINAHIALDSQTKTVAGGALWYEETLPPETLLYVPLLAQRSRANAKEWNAKQTLNDFKTLFEDHSWLQLGGNETVGMGWCGLTVLEA